MDDNSITITRDFPAEPPPIRRLDIPSTQSLTILADATNGTLFYDVDAKTVVTIKNFSPWQPHLSGRFVRVAARYQSNGSLVAVRIWVANAFNNVWLSPEGHVLHVNTTTDASRFKTNSAEARETDRRREYGVLSPDAVECRV